MATQDRVRWDAHYRERKLAPYPKPDPFLLQWTPPVEEGAIVRALDVAAGVGQNGLWLAEQGYITDIMEISRVALSRARAEVTIRNLRNVNLLQTDLDELDLEDQTYDLVCVFRYLKRELFPILKSAVTYGGRIIYETFNQRYLDIVPEFNADFLLQPGELLAIFTGWTLLYEDEESHVSRIVAVKTKESQNTHESPALDW